jgi:hypothetical protein
MSATWQAVAQSGVDLSTIPQSSQEKLVSTIADQLMVTMNSMLDEIAEESAPGAPGAVPVKGAAAGEVEDEFAEKILWEGRPFLSLVERYIVTNERIKIIRGLLNRNVENYELIRVQDIDFKQNVGERMIGYGDIFLRGHDPSDPQFTLRNVEKPEEVYEILRKAWMDARKRHGLQFREYM